MHDIDDGTISARKKSGNDASRPHLRSAAIVVALTALLAACSLVQPKPTEAAAEASPPVVTEPLGPIALAPSLTGVPTPPPAPVRPEAARITAVPLAPPAPPPPEAPPIAAVPPPPPTPAEPAAPPPAPAAAIPATVPIICPPGSIAMWSEPDLAGTAVPICRRLKSLR
jgi:hypothetical protein